ncbi:hypothetical protein ACFYO7_30045 [Nocardia salmonicida]|uniref:hypothetical protein n=1 Tax=Nocardia salmonicida TaxID=53431 RepID=UPI0036B91ADD
MAPDPDASGNPFLPSIGERGDFAWPGRSPFDDLGGGGLWASSPWDLLGRDDKDDGEGEKPADDKDKDDKHKDEKHKESNEKDDKGHKDDDPGKSGGTGSPGVGAPSSSPPKSSPKGNGGGPSGRGNPGGGTPSGNRNSGGGNKPESGADRSGGSNPSPRGDHGGGSPIKVDPQDLIDKGKRLAELPSAPKGLFDIFSTLNDTLQQLGRPWGADEFGRQFADGATGYSASVEALLGNASRGSNAAGAMPIYAQLLINYGTTIEQAGKAFAAGEDLYAQWILKNYVDENASGDPGPYQGPVSSDPNFGKGAGQDNQAGPPTGNRSDDQGSDSGAAPDRPDGSSGSDAQPDGSNPGDSSAGGPGVDGPNRPSSPNLAMSGTPELSSSLSPDSHSSGSFGAVMPQGSLINGIPVAPALPGAVGPNPYRPTDPATGGPADKPGIATGGTKIGGIAPVLSSRMTEPAFDGEKPVPKPGAPGTQVRAGSAPHGMPSMPGSPPTAGGNQPPGKEKRQERRESPPVEAIEPEVADPWHVPDERVGDR